jgi:hypothetical protein
MKLCYECLDDLDGPVRQQARKTTYGETCDQCKRLETDNPAGAPGN